MTDLFGDELSVVRTNAKPEAAALVEVLMTLRAHPMVAWCERMNSGVARIGGASSASAGRDALTCWDN